MIFEIHAERSANDKKVFYYDNETNTIKSQDGTVFEYAEPKAEDLSLYTIFDKDQPLTKSKDIQVLKIQMGLSCNYSCDYCSQKFVERPPETSKKDIDNFMKKLEVLNFNEQDGLKVEFWGGEPLVYWKTMKPLAEAIWEKFDHWENKPQFSIITNGSLFTPEIIDWLMQYRFSISVSHDGPGQSVRGPDPFDDPEKKELILGFYRMQTRLGRGFSFNPMMNVKNKSRKEIYDWFVNLTGDEDVILGEGGIVDAYDADGLNNSLQTKQEHFEYRRTAFADFFTNEKIGFFGQIGKIDGFIDNVLSHRNVRHLGQKCGMDNEHIIAVDMRGNVITCQNVSATQTSMNGESHFAGTLDDYDNVNIKTARHWSKRDHCSECPVLHICKGACMFLEGEYWTTSCANSYSDNVVIFALAFEAITGYIPTLIKGDHLPLERQDIFGTVYTHEEKPKKRVIPIAHVSEITNKIDGVPVYGKASINSQ